MTAGYERHVILARVHPCEDKARIHFCVALRDPRVRGMIIGMTGTGIKMLEYSKQGTDKALSIQQFRDTVISSFNSRSRENMPWRENPSPYNVLLSEFMLQQTQVSRVLSYFKSFISRWKTIEDLAFSPLSAVLKAWQGLGYNRRAGFLHNCAKAIVKHHKAKIPSNKEDLEKLPGIGDYTSSAILAFAFNVPCVVLETNIRRAIIYAFFSYQNNISDNEIRYYVEKTMDKQHVRIWYWALMDYGFWLKYQIVNPNRRSKTYKKQGVFYGSNRQLRGAIVRILTQFENGLDKDDIYAKLKLDLANKRNTEDKTELQSATAFCLEKLAQEGLLVHEKKRWYIP